MYESVSWILGYVSILLRILIAFSAFGLIMVGITSLLNSNNHQYIEKAKLISKGNIAAVVVGLVALDLLIWFLRIFI